MIIGPKYKIARRLGANIFEKTQTQKFAQRQERKGGKGPWRPKSNFGLQMLEKQKARISYGLTERQFSKYVKEASAKKGVNTLEALFSRLEMRLDNVAYRLGFASTRAFARQLVSHGHIMVNGKRVMAPSYKVESGDIISVRPASFKKPVFAKYDEKMKEVKIPSWLSYDSEKKVATVTSAPKYVSGENVFDLSVVVEFYSR